MRMQMYNLALKNWTEETMAKRKGVVARYNSTSTNPRRVRRTLLKTDFDDLLTRYTYLKERQSKVEVDFRQLYKELQAETKQVKSTEKVS